MKESECDDEWHEPDHEPECNLPETVHKDVTAFVNVVADVAGECDYRAVNQQNAEVWQCFFGKIPV